MLLVDALEMCSIVKRILPVPIRLADKSKILGSFMAAPVAIGPNGLAPNVLPGRYTPRVLPPAPPMRGTREPRHAAGQKT